MEKQRKKGMGIHILSGREGQALKVTMPHFYFQINGEGNVHSHLSPLPPPSSQIYDKLQEVTTFRRQHYNYHCVPEIRFYLLHTPMEAEDELHDISHRKEPKQSHAAGSQASLRSLRGSFSSITSIPSGFLQRFRYGSVTSVT